MGPVAPTLVLPGALRDRKPGPDVTAVRQTQPGPFPSPRIPTTAWAPVAPPRHPIHQPRCRRRHLQPGPSGGLAGGLHAGNLSGPCYPSIFKQTSDDFISTECLSAWSGFPISGTLSRLRETGAGMFTLSLLPMQAFSDLAVGLGQLRTEPFVSLGLSFFSRPPSGGTGWLHIMFSL